MTQLINNQRANGYIKSLTWRVWDYLYVRQSVHFSACVFMTHSHSMFGEIAGVSAPVSASTPVKLIHFRAPWHHSRFCSCMQAERAARPLAHHRVVGRIEREKYEHFSYKKGQQHPIKTRRASKSEEKNRIKCRQTTDASTSVPSVGGISPSHHVYDLTFTSGGGGDGCGLTGEKAAKPVTTVQDCVPQTETNRNISSRVRSNRREFLSQNITFS